jgi:hypothetical protein
MTTTRSSRSKITFKREFSVPEVDHNLPAGTYEVLTDEELIEGLSFPVWRRISTMILVPGRVASCTEMVTISPKNLQDACLRDDADDEEPKSARS